MSDPATPPAPPPDAPILLFDSGVGGLSVLAELRAALPQAPVLYFADLAGLPYGTKTEAEVAARVSGLLGRLAERYAPRLACIACNTASTIALGMVRDVLEIPIVGTVPAIKPAAERTRSGTIGLLGTQATIRQGYVDRLEARFASGKRLLRHAAPALVGAAEDKLQGRKVDMEAVRAAVAGLREAPDAGGMDTVVLACTHFPLLREELAEVFGPDVALVDGAAGIARQIARLVEGQPLARSRPDAMLVNAPVEDRDALLRSLAPYGLDRIETL